MVARQSGRAAAGFLGCLILAALPAGGCGKQEAPRGSTDARLIGEWVCDKQATLDLPDNRGKNDLEPTVWLYADKLRMRIGFTPEGECWSESTDQERRSAKCDVALSEGPRVVVHQRIGDSVARDEYSVLGPERIARLIPEQGIWLVFRKADPASRPASQGA
jgi:hypothetical protein